jgi:hypothetical protein
MLLQVLEGIPISYGGMSLIHTQIHFSTFTHLHIYKKDRYLVTARLKTG